MTDLNVSVALKLTLARFLNSSLVMIALNLGNVTRWFDRGGLANDMIYLMILMAVTDPIVYLINPPTIINKI